MTALAHLEEVFGDRLHTNEPLARYMAVRLGGLADVLVIAEQPTELVIAAVFAWTETMPYRILGGGANVLPADDGFRGLVIINRTAGVDFGQNGMVQVESGVNLSTLARRCMARGLGGLEWAVNVPGTVGGAVINNAGAFGGDMADCVRQVVLHRPGRVEQLSGAEMAYSYRSSALKGSREPYVLTTTTLELAPDCDPAVLRQTADEYVTRRKATQPPGASLGSIFKNPPGDYAGRLIEAAGLKGRQIGGVQISPLHANFMINLGEASATDYRRLIQLAQETVAARFGVTLELEIELL